MKIYAINDIVPTLKGAVDFFVGVFENTEDPEIEWPHRHSFLSIVWFTQGTGFNVIDFEEFEINPNRIFTVGPKQIHNWSYSADSKGYYALVSEHLAMELNLDFQAPYSDIPDSDRYFVTEIFKRLLEGQAFSEHRTVSESNLNLNRTKIAISYLCSLLSCHKPNLSSNPTIGEFKKLISETYEARLSVDQYASRLNVSKSDLYTLCLQVTGLTPKQLELDLKVTDAKRLLLYSDLNISEIAYKLGLDDTSYFSRLFKRKTQLSPTEFKQKYRIAGKKS